MSSLVCLKSIIMGVIESSKILREVAVQDRMDIYIVACVKENFLMLMKCRLRVYVQTTYRLTLNRFAKSHSPPESGQGLH